MNKLFKDIKKVEMKLTPLKIKEDHYLIFELLEGINMTPLPDSLEKKKSTDDFYETSVKSPVTKKRNIAMQLKKRKELRGRFKIKNTTICGKSP